MISAARIAANRANAQKSTGPKTAAGKARVAGNARRHGLSLAVPGEACVQDEIAALARAIVGARDAPHLLPFAARIAAAQADLARIRRARGDLLSKGGVVDLWRLAALEYYERRARVRRKFAVRDFAAARELCTAGLAAEVNDHFAKTNPTDPKPKPKPERDAIL
jgi:hypothetical protein